MENKVHKRETRTIEFIANYKIVIFVLLFILLSSCFNYARFSTNDSFPDDISYVFLNNLHDYASFNTEGINVFYELVLELGFLLGESLAAIIIIILIWVINIILFNNVVDRLLKDNSEQIIANALLLFASITIASISIFSYFPAIILVLLWVIRSSIKTPKLTFIPIIAGLLINTQLFIASFIVSVVMYILILIFNNQSLTEIMKINHFINLNVIIPLVAFLASYFLEILSTETILYTGLQYINSSFNFIISLSIVYIALTFLSFFLAIKNKKVLISSLIILCLGMFNIYARIIACFLCIFLASRGILHLIKRQWFVKELKKPTLMLVILLITFYVITQSELIINSEPTLETINDINNINLLILSNNIDTIDSNNLPDNIPNAKSNKILMDPVDMKFFKYFSNLTTYHDQEENINFILENSNYKKMNGFFIENNVSYVYISDRVLNKRWSRSDKGILLLLTQSNSFIPHNITKNSIFYTYKRNESLNLLNSR